MPSARAAGVEVASICSQGLSVSTATSVNRCGISTTRSARAVAAEATDVADSGGTSHTRHRSSPLLTGLTVPEDLRCRGHRPLGRGWRRRRGLGGFRGLLRDPRLRIDEELLLAMFFVVRTPVEGAAVALRGPMDARCFAVRADRGIHIGRFIVPAPNALGVGAEA